MLPSVTLNKPDTKRVHLVQRSLVLLVSVFALLLCILSVLATLGIGLQSTVRAYVGGEGLWSKAEKDAIIDLAAYLQSGKEEDFERFHDHLQVPMGDRQARESLDGTHPDFPAARHGLLEGRNHPDDVDAMMRFFRRFRTVPELNHAISTWAQADEVIVELRSLAERIHGRVSAGSLSASDRDAFRGNLSQLNARLTTLEDDFSSTLGEAARRVHRLLVAAIIGISIILVGIGTLATQQIAVSLSRNDVALRASERRYRDLFEQSPAALYRASLDGRLLECNSALARLFGYASTDDVLQVSTSDLYLDLPDREPFLKHSHDQPVLTNYEVRLKRRDGTPLWGLLNERIIPGEGMGEAVLEGSLLDITERKEVEQESQYRASHDPLTELPNRGLFKDRLAHAIHHAKRWSETVSVMFVDLDFFKRVNDTLGHAGGDELLIQVGRRLTGLVRAEDTVARFGGDEFMLFLSRSRSPVTGLDAVAAKILRAFSEPFTIQGREVAVSASVGISHYPEDGADPDALVANADKALYRAKKHGRNNFQYFQSES
jgi:diguanylate cyclase (GGDEF)-like protein/PAS domain S-box-containing protein